MKREEDEEECPASFWLHHLDSSPAFIYIYISAHHGYLEDLVYYYYCITALLVKAMTEVSFLMGEDENVKSFLWKSFHAWRAAKVMAAEQEWEMESERMPGALLG